MAAKIKKGALHRQLGYAKDEPIPTGVLRRIEAQNEGTHIRVNGESRAVTPKLKKRVRFALSFR